MPDLVEFLFWFPTVMDLLLLVFTYTSCRHGGPKWYFDQMPTVDEDNKKDDDAKKKNNNEPTSGFRINQLWQLAMAAYSGYACLLPWATYQCYLNPELRVSFCSAMMILMILKLENVSKMDSSILKDSKNLSLLVLYFPTYGGYVVMKTFFSS